jgi:hypothetical protein
MTTATPPLSTGPGTRVPVAGSGTAAGGPSPPDDDDDSSSSSGSNDGSDEDDRRQRRRGQAGRRATGGAPRQRRQQRRHRKNAKDLVLTNYKPSPTVSVSTWIAKVDLAVEGARVSGRGHWTDKELYFIAGNKLQENAGSWWVQMDQELPDEGKTWTRLKAALVRRYGERPDQTMAEWRVYQRMMYPGETFADFAAGLRELTGQNHVSERTLLSQFYRNLDKTTRMLVKQEPAPATLEQAVDKATAIDDPIDNVAQGMMNIGQAWATAPSAFSVPMNGTMGNVAIVPGVGSRPSADSLAAQTGVGNTEVAYFTTPQDVYNKYTGTWDVPDGRFWNGRYWQPNRRNQPSRASLDQRSGGKRGSDMGANRAKIRLTMAAEESDDGEAAEDPPPSPQPKRQKGAVRTAVADRQPIKTGDPAPNSTGPRGGRWPTAALGCFACGQQGHFARECPDEAAKARNDAFLAARVGGPAGRAPPAENADRA